MIYVLLAMSTRAEFFLESCFDLFWHQDLGMSYPGELRSMRFCMWSLNKFGSISSLFGWKNGCREFNHLKLIVLVQLNTWDLLCYRYKAKYVLKHCAGTEEVGEPGQILSHADNVLPGLWGLRTVMLHVVTSVVVCSHVSPASVAPQLSPTGLIVAAARRFSCNQCQSPYLLRKPL